MPQGRRVSRSGDGVYTDEDVGKLDDLDLLAFGLLVMFRSATTTQTPKNQGMVKLGNVAIAKHNNDYIVSCNGVVDEYVITKSTPLSLQDVATRGDLVKAETVPSGELDKLVKEDKLYSVINRAKDGSLLKKYFAPVHYRVRLKDQAAEQIRRMLADSIGGIAPPTTIIWLSPSDSFNPHAEMRIVKHFNDEGWGNPAFIGVCKPCCENCAGALESKGVSYSRWSPLGEQHTGWMAPEEITGTVVKTLQ